MLIRISNNGLLLFFIITILSLTGCGKTLELSSRWCDREIVIDGDGEEWGSATLYVPEAKVALTLFNDDDFMYIRMHTRDREVQTQVLRAGLIVWFDPTGGKSEVLGIHYPMGVSFDGQTAPPQYMIRESQDMMEQMVKNLPDKLEILAQGDNTGDTLTSAQTSQRGINIALGFVKGNLIYELKMPLQQTKQHPLAIGITDLRTDAVPAVGIGFETPKIDMSDMREKMKEQMPEGLTEGRPVMDGGMPAGPPGDRSIPESLKLWVSVTLAEK